MKYNHNNRLITKTIITLGSAQCNFREKLWSRFVKTIQIFFFFYEFILRFFTAGTIIKRISKDDVLRREKFNASLTKSKTES
jgi:hypothetical protein